MEESTRAGAAAERGEVSPLTGDSCSRKKPPLRNRPREHRFQKLPNPSPAVCLNKSALNLSLASKAGQEERAKLQSTERVTEALEEGARSAELVFLLPPQE
jgi:hypothetical protein